MRRVVVTGGGGFIGRELAPLLVNAGHEVHLLGRSRNIVNGCTNHVCDLLTGDPAPLLRDIRADSLIHLAWYAKPGAFWDASENLDWVAASLRLVQAFAEADGHRVLIAGTCAEYDWTFSELDERRTPIEPSTLYGVAKASLFRMLQSAAPILGISLAWGRIFFPYGPHEQPGRLLSSLIDGIAENKHIDFSEGLQSRDFIHVHDVARAFMMLLDSELEGPVNIASGKTARVRDFVKIAARLAGGEELLRFGSRPLHRAEPHYMAAKVNRLQGEIGFRPHFDLSAGLADTVQRRTALRSSV